MTLTEHITQLICGFDATALSQAAIDRARLAIMDCVGVALAGAQESVSAIVRKQAMEGSGRPQATIWGIVEKVSVLDAALVNGTMAHALDYDDMNRSMLGHPSAVLAPVLLALGEAHRLPGARLLRGHVLGLEAMARVGRIFGTPAYEKSWHPTAILGAIGSCAAASYLLRLNPEQTRNALGIAASEASGIKKNFGSMTKALHAGSAARKGIWAAGLAQSGLTAGPDALDGTFGYMHMFNGTPYDAPAPGDSEDLEILRAGLVYKAYPCCGGLHSVVDNVLILRDTKGLRAEKVAEIECRVHPSKVAYLDRPRAATPLEAKFSIQYCAAVALLRGNVGLREFEAESVARADARALMTKIRVAADPALASFASEVRVRNVDGAQYANRVAEPKGSGSFPLSEADLVRKFVDCAMATMSHGRAQEAADALMKLDSRSDIESVLRLLVADQNVNTLRPSNRV